MGRSRFELPDDRLSTTDDSGARIYLKPDVTRGRFFRIRQWFQPLLIVFFLALPWVRIAGEPAILLDITHRRFTLFGTVFWGHDVPLLFFIFVIFSLVVALITAVWGRLWCGWACPQTVFIEGVFRKLERWIEGFERGSYRTSQLLPEGPAGWAKWLLKWAAFLVVSLVLAHAFIAYFVGTDHLMRMMIRSPSEEPGWFLFMAIVTVIVLFDFGWFREQFCIIACPYGRIQSLFIDSQTKLVAYDQKRGEPRKGTEAKGEKSGDCVNCFRCVQVCPTGIDIRRGNQLECVACTACIDACDEVMEKTKKPAGLIRHASLDGMEGRPTKILRPRTIAYFALVCLAVGGFTFALSVHQEVGVDVLRASGLPYEVLAAPQGKLVLNHFHAEIWNSSRREQGFSLSLPDEFSKQGIELVASQLAMPVAAGAKRRLDFFIKAPKALFQAGRAPVSLAWEMGDRAGQQVEVTLVGPAN